MIVIQADLHPEELHLMPILASTPMTGLTAHTLAAFASNYLWLLQAGDSAIVVDPGDADVIDRALQELGLTLAAILLTHHHADHIGGAAALASRARCPVFGPVDTRIPMVTHACAEGDIVSVSGFPPIAVWHVPGHTRTHLAFLVADAIFVGDTLFGAGCGRVFEGEYSDLHGSLQRIAALPAHTRVFCAHEYTRANLAFAAAVEPQNPAILARLNDLSDGRPSVPFVLADEFASNMFLRCDEDSVRAAASRESGHDLHDAMDVFAALRQWKNVYV